MYLACKDQLSKRYLVMYFSLVNNRNLSATHQGFMMFEVVKHKKRCIILNVDLIDVQVANRSTKRESQVYVK